MRWSQFTEKEMIHYQQNFYKIINAFKVYYIYEKFGAIKSFYYTLRLSIYYLLKENLIRNKNLYQSILITC